MSRGGAILVLGFLVSVAACGGDRAATTTGSSVAKIGGLAELEALLKQSLGRGALVNVWATW